MSRKRKARPKVERAHRAPWSQHESPALVVCESGKRRFASRTKAKRAARDRVRANKAGRLVEEQVALNPYLCPLCGAWHLTKQPQREG